MAQCAAALVVLNCMGTCFIAVRTYMRTHAAHLTAWKAQQWWWRQCSDIEFYERVQAHMEVCDNLKVVPHSSVWKLAAHDAATEVLLTTWPICAALLVVAAAVGVTGAVAQRMPPRGPGLPRQRPTV
jgi:hypothetical protein